MLIPALFVADAVRSRLLASANHYDVIVFSQASEVSEVHTDWMRDRGILFRDDIDMSRLTQVKQFSGRLTAATLMKLMLAEHLAGEYDRLLYLDCDLTIHGDVGRIFSLDTGPFEIAATPAGRILSGLSEEKRREARAHFKALGMSEPYRYFNAGVLYIDVAKWNQARLGERALAYIRRNPDLCVLPDEDALNAIVDGNIAELSPIWNPRPIAGEREWARLCGHPVIAHHAGPDKPWQRYGRRKRLFPDRSAYRLYEAFLKDTPWPGWLDRQWDARDFWASVLWELKRVSRRLRGKLGEPTAEQRKAYRSAILRYWQESSLADVEQGLVERRDGKFRLASLRGD
ncbi:MAG TPA: glycosyltransferase [Rhizobiaceae bacterium]